MMWYDDYNMGFGRVVDTHEYNVYRAGLMDPWQIVAFYQDLIEANCLPAAHLHHATHLVEMGLCHISARALH